MKIATCILSIVPLRAEASHRSEMVSQVLFGESFEILEEGKDFTKILLSSSKYIGWIQNHQFALSTATSNTATKKIIGIGGGTAQSNRHRIHLVHGTPVYSSDMMIDTELFQIAGDIRIGTLDDFETEFPKLIDLYKDSPYMWGGRSTAGIDCSGFSQVVYSHFGIQLLRDAWQQAESGNTVDFLTEIKAGDLAFFDNADGRITHVGVMIDAETIIHASGRIRIDKMDNEGIFNADQNKYTHKLRIVKRYF